MADNRITVTTRNQYGEPMETVEGIIEREHDRFGRFVVHKNTERVSHKTAGFQYKCTDATHGVGVGYGSRPELAYLSAIRKLESFFASYEDYVEAIREKIKPRPEVAD